MKFSSASLALAALIASTTLVSASNLEHSNIDSVVRRHNHRQHARGSCSSSNHSKPHKAKQVSSDLKKPAGSKSSSQSKSGSSSDSSANSSSSSSSSSGSSSAHGKTSGGKMGLCWANANGMPISNFDFGSVSWFYSWDATPGWDAAPVDKLMYCPMLWGYKNVDSFKKNVLDNQNSKFNQHKCAMAMNEVNQKGQSDMSPQDGCKLIEQYLLPLKDNGWYLMGPSTTNAPDGKVWYQNFKKACPDTFNKLDSIAIHYYGTDVNDFKTYLQDWYKTFGKEIWVTEFGCTSFNGQPQCDKTKTDNFATEIATFMNQQDWVKGWAPFAVIQNLQGVSETQRLSNGNSPTALFHTYAQSS
ncbi:hypothetical protein PHSY_002188 [Pseudozyma hubeiensis SY62]|uniref:Asl1-like glycosyl hydrolase catalytic domain-containing protein n=1 Tax=Pseudozyma hubeiensis (strain SY62) TaxID=1305764 RepID=R9P935_PSEHS|nr:hypothetical protein PHSY_002188 [Pseudozyma hubeiensis SY62]GAC94615.1 hypothetical protein PHSY_002188 [Pseudozyma hubeiensis SY62]